MRVRVIDPTGDFRLTVTEAEDTNNTILFLVSRSVLEKHTTHELAADIRNCTHHSFNIYDTNVFAMETILRILHGVPSLNQHTNFDKSFDQESLEGLYQVLDLGMKWFKTEELEDWFTKFWVDRSHNKMSLYEMKVLLYPAYIFRHAEAFARITKSLVFEWKSGEMHGLNPLTGRAEFRFENRILKQLQRLKTRILEREITNKLLDPLDSLCNDFCTAGGDCMVSYNKALRDCLVIPSSVRRGCSIKDILESEGVSSWNCTTPMHVSDRCLINLSGEHIFRIKKNALNFWEGMCIECVFRTSGGHLKQELFWEDGRHRVYGASCPISHDYQTWNYSYMGPFELMSKHIAEQKEREKDVGRMKHAMKFAAKPTSTFASNSPKRTRRHSSVRFSTPDAYAIQQQQKIAEWTANNQAAKTESQDASARSRSKDTTHYSTSSPNTPSKNSVPIKSETLDKTALLQLQKIAEWTTKNLANQARMKEAEAQAKADETNTHVATRSFNMTDMVGQELEVHNHDLNNNPISVTTSSLPVSRTNHVAERHESIDNTSFPHSVSASTRSSAIHQEDRREHFEFPKEMHTFNSIPVNKSAPKNDWIAQRLALYNNNRAGAMAHQRRVNGETEIDSDDAEDSGWVL